MFAGSRPTLLFAFVVALIVFRQIGAAFELHHFQPYIALFFALAALKKAQWLLIPAIGYLASTLIAQGVFQFWMLSPLLAFALIVFWGRCFSQKSSAPVLLGGSLAGAGIFYLVTNTFSWLTSPHYTKSLGGLSQALWTGIPGYPPTWTFFRNDALATVLFTAIILVLNQMTFRKRAKAALPVSA